MTANNAFAGAFTNVPSGSRVTVTGGPGSFLVSYNGNSLILSSYNALMRSRLVVALQLPADGSNSTSGASSPTPTKGPAARRAVFDPDAMKSAAATFKASRATGRSTLAAVRSRIPAITITDSSQLGALLDNAPPATKGKVVVAPGKNKQHQSSITALPTNSAATHRAERHGVAVVAARPANIAR